jgi:ElaB/YqjD/DUF883 family membrane-anchored ribosome-binding protein
MTDTGEAIDRRDEALERLFEALRAVLEWNGATPESTLRQIRQIARATLAEAQAILVANCKAD